MCHTLNQIVTSLHSILSGARGQKTKVCSDLLTRAETAETSILIRIQTRRTQCVMLLAISRVLFAENWSAS